MLYVWGAVKRVAAEEVTCQSVTCVGVVELPVQVSGVQFVYKAAAVCVRVSVRNGVGG